MSIYIVLAIQMHIVLVMQILSLDIKLFKSIYDQNIEGVIMSREKEQENIPMKG